MAEAFTLHGFFRSSASYRVRIALNLKGLSYDQVTYQLRLGEQRGEAYLGLNPQGLVPALQMSDAVLTQSLAICEYLDETYPEPALLPSDALGRARVRAFCDIIACDIHPIQNLKILNRLRSMGLGDEAVNNWAQQVIEEGFDACEALLAGTSGAFCFGDAPGLADICLVPQVANAERFGVKMRWPRIEAIVARCQQVDAFVQAAPGQQPDAG